MSEKDEGGGRKTDWGLTVAVAGLLLGVYQYAQKLNDNSAEKAVVLEARLTVIECQLGLGRCEKGSQ